MDFDLDDQQSLLKDSVNRLIADRYSFEDRKRFALEPNGWSRALWRQYAELGLLGLPFSEEDGGFGGGPIEIMLAMEALGRGLALEPFFATVVLAGTALRLAGNSAQRRALVSEVRDGRLLLALAHGERQARYELNDVAARAQRDGEGWVVDGSKTLVLHGDCADKLIVSARTSGERRDDSGVSLFLIDADAVGISRRGYPTQDGLRAADISFTGVRVHHDSLLGEVNCGLSIIERVVEAGIAALAAEAVGAMAVLLDTTVGYLKSRVQFGAPLSKLQVLQHRSADMLAALEMGRSMAQYAAMMLSEPNDRERRAAMSAVKIQIGRSSRFVGQQAVQLHGGIGMTDEYLAGHYFRRLTVSEMQFGDSDYHLTRLASLGGLIHPDAFPSDLLTR